MGGGADFWHEISSTPTLTKQFCHPPIGKTDYLSCVLGMVVVVVFFPANSKVGPEDAPTISFLIPGATVHPPNWELSELRSRQVDDMRLVKIGHGLLS